MTVLITCGLHPKWCDFAQSRLTEMGILLSEASERSKLNGVEILEKMSKASKVSASRSRVFRQIKPGKAWQISAADLFVHNSDNDAWGWAHPNNIFFLEFWRDFDPNCRFVLVYGSVANYAAFDFDSKGEFGKNASALTERWITYNEELLRFYYENPERCLLVDIRTIEGGAAQFRELLNRKFDVKARLINTNHHLDISQIKRLASNQLFADIETPDLLSELENSADLPADEVEGKQAIAWNAVEEYESVKRELKAATLFIENLQIQAVEKDNIYQAELKAEAAKHEQDIEALKSKLNASQISLDAALANLEKVKIEAPESAPDVRQAESNEILLLQLAQVQEELKYYFDKYTGQTNGKAAAVQKTTHVPTSGTIISSVPKISEGLDDQDGPQSLTIDLRKYVNGEGWHNPEIDGRWAGLDLTSTVKVKSLPIAAHRIDMTLIDAMSFGILKAMTFKFDGNEIKPTIKLFSHLQGPVAPLRRLKAAITKHEKPFPVMLSYMVPANLVKTTDKGHWIEITVPETKTPSAVGLNDFRDLSICVQTIIVTRLG